MERLLILMLVLVCQQVVGQQSPHGSQLKEDCSVCHTSNGWKVDLVTFRFDHTTTGFELDGQHHQINCRQCHTSLVFKEVQGRCVACHQDVHQQTVGDDCSRCHTSSNWIVEKVLEIHRQSRFPLNGLHGLADCIACHLSGSGLVFEPIGIDCYNCHRENYLATTKPKHIEVGYSTDCVECHSLNAYQWDASGFNHSFFPLTLGHATSDCIKCHGENKYAPISAECVDCHLADFNSATNPVHDRLSFSLQCANCHTINPNWQPAEYRIHDSNSFPIYSGSHRGAWKSCTECHKNSNDYSQFGCIDCHEHNRLSMNAKHNDERDSEYNSDACFSCHPRGRAEDN